MNYNITYTERANQRLQVATELMKGLLHNESLASKVISYKDRYVDRVVKLADMLIKECENPRESTSETQEVDSINSPETSVL